MRTVPEVEGILHTPPAQGDGVIIIRLVPVDSQGYRGHHARYYGGHGCHRTAPAWHGPSMHYDRVYHPTYRHWTPQRGLHTHGHYDYAPHYVPGHYDRWHNGHIDLNPRFHH
jgi:hypothetical protein